MQNTESHSKSKRLVVITQWVEFAISSKPLRNVPEEPKVFKQKTALDIVTSIHYSTIYSIITVAPLLTELTQWRHITTNVTLHYTVSQISQCVQ